jgi:hypothetical protein
MMATKVWFGPGAHLGIYDYSKRSHPNLLMGESKDKGVLLLTCSKCPCGSYQPKEKEGGGSGWSWTVIGDSSESDDDGWSWGENESKGTTPQLEAKVLGTFVVYGADEGMEEADLTDYHGSVMGNSGAYWRLMEVGEAHALNGSAGCTGVSYGSGTIAADGTLVGLPARFRSTYYYTGYLEIQQGYRDSSGNIVWPC